LIIYKKDSIRKKRRIDYIREIASKYREVSYKEIEYAYEKAYFKLDVIWRETSRTPSAEEFVALLGSMINLFFTADEIEIISEFIQQTIIESPPRLMNGALKIISRLAQDYKLSLISNTGITIGTTLREILKKKKLLDKFGIALFSNETPFGKPHPTIFQPLIDTFNVLPENVVHIGDNEEADIAGARASGMHSILLNSNGKVKSSADFVIKNLYEIPEKIDLLDSKVIK